MFARYPDPGRVKTRLIPALGAVGAAELHRRMLARTLACARELAERAPLTLELRLDRIPDGFAKAEDALARANEQGPGDLGERLSRAVEEAFAGPDDPARRVVVIGTDCPELSGETVTRAFAKLDGHDVVLGPAADGGYYLIALSAPAPELFSGIDWGSDRVCAQTMSRARSGGLSVGLLGVLDDIDTPDDLAVWERVTGEAVAIDE